MLNSPEIAADGTVLTVNLASGPSRFHAVWLRDNSQHSDTRSATNGQRLITLLQQPANINIQSATLVEDALLIKFSGEPDNHVFPLKWLETHQYDRPACTQQGWTNSKIERWDHQLQKQLPTGYFPEVSNNPAALRDWLAAIQRYGFAVMKQLPADPEALLEVVNLFGYVRETNYGRYFEVRSEVNPVNLAYTGLGLQAHTDNPYRDPVPTLQILACLENTTRGGESIVVDGFQAVAQLQQEAPSRFELLHRYCSRFQFAGADGVQLDSKRPMIELNPDGELIAVRFNNRSAAPFTDIPYDVMAEFYQAYRHFAEIIERPHNALCFQLEPGELFIVDNTRVLHSRTAFSGEGKRWLRGCYADKDSLLSTLVSLEKAG